jgi:hypothetical protein
MMSLPFIVGVVTYLVIIGAAWAACPRVGPRRKYAEFSAEFNYLLRGREGCNIDPASVPEFRATGSTLMADKLKRLEDPASYLAPNTDGGVDESMFARPEARRRRARIVAATYEIYINNKSAGRAV